MLWMQIRDLLGRKVISIRDIEYVGQMATFLPFNYLRYLFVWNGNKCNYISVFPQTNSASKRLAYEENHMRPNEYIHQI